MTPTPTGTFLDLPPFRPPGGPERPVRAFVPHAAGARPRPLLLLFDGQNVFDDHGSFAGGWHAHAAAGRLAEAPIVVGVGNGGARRIEEMGHRARDFVAAVRHELLPELEGVLPLAGPERRVIGGASLGGLASLYAWLDHPDAFGGALVMSPSLWFADGAVMRELERASRLPESGRLYLDAGARERGRMFADAERLARLLGARGLGGDRLLWRPDRRGTHHERHWRRRLPKALRFLFARRPVRR